MNFEDKLNRALEQLVVEAGVNRRDFLKKSSAGAASLATGSPVGIGKMAANLIGGGGFDKLSDKALMSMSETKWMNKIPYSRLLRIMKTPKYAAFELPIKIITIGTYGPAYKQASAVAKVMHKAFVDSGGSLSQLSAGMTETLKRDMWGYDDPWEFAQQTLADAREAGLNYNEKEIRREIAKDISEKEKEDKLKREKEEEEERNKSHDYAVASPMHQWFENKLNRALTKIV